ncbi:MAG: hypothetical protein LBT96_01220 [Campylobacteraceae bacterium]|jgi:hypothetical protein|nr:hypothetical protein [Campylobacteraceae bacterium]
MRYSKKIFAGLLVISCTFAVLIGADNDIKSEFTLNNNTKVIIIESIFDKNNSDIKLCENGFEICHINRYLAYGVVSDIPKTYVKSIKVFHQNQIYDLNTSGMYDAWGDRLEFGNLNSYFAEQCKDKYNCTFRGLFADAAGAFAAEWQIVNGEDIRTAIGYAMEVDFLFNNLTPKAYRNKSAKIDFTEINNITKLELANNISINVTKNIFDKNKFKIEKCKHINAICLISGRVPFGVSRVSYEIPKTYLSNIIVNHKGVDYSLDTTDMYEMDIVKFGGTCSDELNSCVFRGVLYGKNDYFAAQWRLDIDSKFVKRTALTSSDDIIRWFLKHIDADIFYD